MRPCATSIAPNARKSSRTRSSAYGWFDGQTLRLELGVTRLDEIKPNAPITGRRYPACRLALSANAAVELINRMQQIAALLTQAGLIKSGDGPGKA